MRTAIVLASGGTGGHIFPAEALAVVLHKRGYQPILLTDTRYQDYAGGNVPWEVHTIRASGVGGGIWHKISGVAELGVGWVQARRLLKKIAPAAVIGFGGYPSFPTMHAATALGLPTLIHEQNSMLGKANAVLAAKMHAIATSFTEVKGITEEDAKKIVLTGNPVRPAIKALREMPYPALNEESGFHLLVTGGSQGAAIFSDVLPEAIGLLPPALRQRIRVDQQCRAEDVEKTKEAYEKIAVSADIAPFFGDIAVRLAAAHLVVARSGASTVAELTVAGRPAIFVPYPHATDDHQTVNANAVEDAGGGWVMPQEGFTAAAVSARIESFLNLPVTLKEAAEKIRNAGRPDADAALADLVEKVAKGRPFADDVAQEDMQQPTEQQSA